MDAGGEGKTTGLAGIEIAALHNLNVETRTLPALAVAADVLLPVGGLGPDRAYTSLQGIATRTFSWARFHVNGQYTFGSGPDESPLSDERAAGRLRRSATVEVAVGVLVLLVTAVLVATAPPVGMP